MRFRDIYIKCTQIYPVLEEKYLYWLTEYKIMQDAWSNNKEELNNRAMNNPTLVELRNEVRKKLENIKCFAPTFEKINGAIYERDVKKEIKLYDDLLIKIEFVIELYESMEQPKEDIGLDIKIPETDSITEFKKYVDDLEFIFTKCPFFQSDEASLRFKTVDVGSMWLIIGVAGGVACASVLLNNIAAFIDKCIILKSHKVACEMQELELEKAKIEQRQRDEILEYIKKPYKFAVKNATKELEETTGYKISDGDEEGRVEQSFEKLVNLIDKGLQIYSSIDSPREVKVLFEPLEMHYLSVEKELKKIGTKSSADSDSE